MRRVESRYTSKHRWSRHIESVLLSIVVLFVALIPTIYQTQIQHRDELKMWFFDIGQGDATFIQTPEGSQILVDGGPDDTILQKLAQVMVPWDRTLDAMVVTHPDADHITGLIRVLQEFDVKMVIETGAESNTSFDQALVTAIEQEHSNHRFVKAGDRIQFDTLAFTVLWPDQTYEGEEPENTNATSIVLQAMYGETSVLLMGDAEAPQEVAMQSRLQDVDVLKVGHHGSKSSSSMVFLETIQPEITTISDGVNNRYGHPHPVVLRRLEQVHSTIYRTDQDGDLLLTSTGDEPVVQPSPLPF